MRGDGYPNLIDRTCRHGYIYCPEAGCHDNIAYGEPSGGMVLWMDLLEQAANDPYGTLPALHAKLSPFTGMDGLDELTEAMMLGINATEEDYDLD